MNRHNDPDVFFREKMTEIFSKKGTIIDIGGSLRIDASRNNRRDPANDWLLPRLKEVDYKILDKVPDYHPDIVGDIHNLPFEDASIDAIICISILEHVEEPQRAVRELHRVLKPGGVCFLFAPFLYYYHAEKGYYSDFYRFTIDGMKYLTKDFSSVELVPVRGPLATLMNLIPFLSKRTSWFNWIDRMLRPGSKQVSGYNVFCIK